MSGTLVVPCLRSQAKESVMSVSLEQRMAAVEAELAVIKAQLAGAATALPDVDIDGPHGDPVIRRDPPKWPGESFVGRNYSHCPPNYLESMAGFLQWKAKKEDAEPEKQKYARYSRLDAARALAWSKRNRANGPVATPEEAAAFDDAGDLPF